jgi:hypothetical protein
LVASGGERYAEGEDITRFEAEFLLFEIIKALKKKAGAGEQNDAEGDLSDYEQPTQASVSSGACCARGQRGEAWLLERWNDAEEDRTKERDGYGEENDSEIEASV